MTGEAPEGWRPDAGDGADRALERLTREAADHGGDYAAGMREARRIVEDEPLG